MPDVDVQFLAQGQHVLGGHQAAQAGIADQQQMIHVAGGAPAQVFHAGLVVHDYVVVARADAVDDRAQHMVGRTVAALAFGPAHGQQSQSSPSSTAMRTA